MVHDGDNEGYILLDKHFSFLLKNLQGRPKYHHKIIYLNEIEIVRRIQYRGDASKKRQYYQGNKKQIREYYHKN